MGSPLFLRTLAVTAVLQFFITRARAGRVDEEGAAETLWLLYPFAVILNALLWTAALALARRCLGTLRRLA